MPRTIILAGKFCKNYDFGCSLRPMRDHRQQSFSKEKLETDPKQQRESPAQAQDSSETPHKLIHFASAREANSKETLDANHPFRALAQPTPLSDEQQKAFGELKATIRMFNRTVPELRIELPTWFLSAIPYLSLNLKVCTDYYFKCANLRFDEDAGNKIAACLTSFLEEYPLDWSVCSWKNDFIAEMILGKLEYSGECKKAAKKWLNWYWKRQAKQSRDTNLYLSPKRTAASAAVFELEWLSVIDKNQHLFISPGLRGHATLIRWLNRNWPVLAANKKGPALLQEIAERFREKHRDLSFSDSDLSDICEAYKSQERLYDPGKVPVYQVVLALVARNHGVSPRLVTKMRADQNKFRKSHGIEEKARS
jgi:hypothetical protein